MGLDCVLNGMSYLTSKNFTPNSGLLFTEKHFDAFPPISKGLHASLGARSFFSGSFGTLGGKFWTDHNGRQNSRGLSCSLDNAVKREIFERAV